MEQIKAYRASDGTIFEGRNAAETHEASLAWRSRIELFVKSGQCPYTSGAHLNMTHKVIVAWETWKAEKAQDEK